MTRAGDRTDDESLRKQIMDSIAACKDDNLRAVLLLMLAVLDSIGRKIDAVMRDEQAIREMVLNGDSANHHEDHREWREFKSEWTQLRPTMLLLRDRQLNGGHCAWAAAKIEIEKKDADSRRRVRDGWIERMAWAATVVAVAALSAKYLGGVQ